ncbi:MAG: amino acid ABC transporter substrate-binding protein [Xenococcaceae cyanobacterium]
MEEIERTGVIKVAIRSDAVPFGYINLDNNLTGLCLDFIALLRKEIKRQFNRDILTVRLFKSTLFNRFEIVEQKIVHIECGPNTIRSDIKYDVDFSEPFFITGTQLLIKKEDETRVNPNGTLENITIGLLRETSTEEFIESQYPLASIKKFRGVTGRLRGIQAVGQGKIDVFASDGILLVGEATILGFSLEEDYQLIPELPLTCDYYGMIIPKNDNQWRTFVNSVIESPQSEQILKEWFTVVFPYIRITKDFCQGNRE